MNQKTTIGIGIGFAVLAITIGVIGFNHIYGIPSAKATVTEKLIAGDYDNEVSQKCVERYNSYGLGEMTEGQKNMCTDLAKTMAFNYLTK